jgi:hypothetical protein
MGRRKSNKKDYAFNWLVIRKLINWNQNTHSSQVSRDYSLDFYKIIKIFLFHVFLFFFVFVKYFIKIEGKKVSLNKN